MLQHDAHAAVGDHLQAAVGILVAGHRRIDGVNHAVQGGLALADLVRQDIGGRVGFLDTGGENKERCAQ